MPITTNSAYAKDGLSTSARQYANGAEPAVTAKGDDRAHVTDLANEKEK